MADLPVTMEGLRASVPVKINGKDTSFWLDSGAFFSLMPDAKAAELGLKVGSAPEGFYLVGVGGSASVGLTTVKSFGIVGASLSNVQFLVGGSDVGNGLIGRNLLGIADTEFNLANGSVKLINSKGCNGALAYWAQGKPYFSVELLTGDNPHDHLFKLPVMINGARIDAELDTGAPTSIISRRAAERAGIDLNGPGVQQQASIGGIGRHFKGGWTVPVGSVAVGEEQILRTHLLVIDGNISSGSDAPDMLLGADFVLAHRIYVARQQKRIYFTYSGGKPFIADKMSGSTPEATTPVAVPEGTSRVEALRDTGAEPKTADEFARRGNGRLAQRDFQGAIADLTKAIELSPNAANYLGNRAAAYRRSGQPTLARADMEMALKTDPNNVALLRERAFLRFAEKDRVGALADAEAAVRLTPPSSLDMAELAFLFERLNQPARAVELYDEVIAAHRQDSGLGQLLNGRCWVRALADVELDKALDDCNRAIKRDGAIPAYLDSRGMVEFRQRNFASAIADYDAVLKQAQQAWSLYMRGLTKIAVGRNSDGETDKAAAIAIQPDIALEVSSYGIGRP